MVLGFVPQAVCVWESCSLMKLRPLKWWPVIRVCCHSPVPGGKTPGTCPRLGRGFLWSLVRVWAALGIFLQQTKAAKCSCYSFSGARSSISLRSSLLCVKTCSDCQMRAAPSSWQCVWGCLWLSKWLERSIIGMIISCNPWKFPCWKANSAPVETC